MVWTIFATMIMVKVTKCKSGPFEHAVSMSKWLAGSIYIGNTICYPIYLLYPFPRGLEVDQEGTSIFPILALSMYINRFDLFCHL